MDTYIVGGVVSIFIRAEDAAAAMNQVMDAIGHLVHTEQHITIVTLDEHDFTTTEVVHGPDETAVMARWLLEA